MFQKYAEFLKNDKKCNKKDKYVSYGIKVVETEEASSVLCSGILRHTKVRFP